MPRRLYVPMVFGSYQIPTQNAKAGSPGATLMAGFERLTNCTDVPQLLKFLGPDFLQKIIEKSGFEVWGCPGSHCYCKSKKRVARKLRRIILLHFGLVTFRFHFGKTRKVSMFMIFGSNGHVHDSQNQLFLIWETSSLAKLICSNRLLDQINYQPKTPS